MDTLSDLKMKEYKRSTLNELVDYITISRGCLTEQTYPEVVRMVSFSLLQTTSRVAVWFMVTMANIAVKKKEKLYV